MGTIKSGLNVNTPDRIFVDAGAVYINYGLADQRLLGATRGGNEWNLNREIRDVEVDGVKGPTKGLRRVTTVRPQITCNLIELSLDNLLKAIAGSSSAETPKTKVVDAEYVDVGTALIDDSQLDYFPVVPGSEKLYVNGTLKARGTQGDSHFVGDDAENHKAFTVDEGDWVQGVGGTLSAAENGVSGKAGKFVANATSSKVLPKLLGGGGTVLTNLVVGNTYKFVISTKYVAGWTGGIVTVTIGGVDMELTTLTESYIQDVISFTAQSIDASIVITCASGMGENDEFWMDSLELKAYTGDYTIVNATGAIQWIFDNVPDVGENVTASYVYETTDASTHDTISGGDIADSNYITNVALVGTISGKDEAVICMVHNALADAGLS